MSIASPRLGTSIDERPTVGPSSRRGLMTVLLACFCILTTYLPFSGVSAVLGVIGRDAGASTSDLQWITDAYALALASVVLSAGVIGDLYGRKRVALSGLVLTLVGVIVGFSAGSFGGTTSVHVLWVGQALAGIGGGAVMSSTLALISSAVPDVNDRNRAIAYWASSLVIGLAAGPFLAGAIAEYGGWRWIFPPIVVLAVGAIVLGAIVLEDSSASEGRRLDWPGQLTGMLAIAAVIYRVIEGGESGWGSTANVAGLIAGGILLCAFVLVERRSPSPLLRLDLFRSAAFTASGLAAMVVLFTLVGVLFVLSLFFSTVQHLSPLHIALRLAILFGTNALAGPVAARLHRSFAARVPLILGLFIAAVGMFALTTIGASSDLVNIGWRLAMTGVGCGLVMSTASAVAVQAVSPHLAGMAGAANNAIRQLGASLGPAVLGVVLSSQLQAGHTFASALQPCLVIGGLALGVTALTCAFLLRETK